MIAIISKLECCTGNILVYTEKQSNSPPIFPYWKISNPEAMKQVILDDIIDKILRPYKYKYDLRHSFISLIKDIPITKIEDKTILQVKFVIRIVIPPNIGNILKYACGGHEWIPVSGLNTNNYIHI